MLQGTRRPLPPDGPSDRSQATLLRTLQEGSAGAARRRGERGSGAVRQAARRRARARARADAGAAVRDAAARPARRRRGEGRAPSAASRAAGRSPACSTRGPLRRRHLPAQQPRQAQRRHRPQAPTPAASSFLAPGAAASTSSPRTSRPARWIAWAWATTTSPPRTPRSIYVSISGFGNTAGRRTATGRRTPSIVEAMSGIYDYKLAGRRDRRAPNPVGALGDISSGAVRHHRHPRRAAPPRPHRRGPVRRHRHVRRDRRHDRHRHQLLVAWGRTASTSPGAVDPRRVPRRPTAGS